MERQVPVTPFPEVPEHLLRELERRFPERCPELDAPDRKIWHYAGQRYVVKLLRSMFDQQLQRGASASVSTVRT